ncbi:MAG: aminomethyltransferase family protein [Deltaproteobacteria bacterium]|nr:aminomethyltransferase family protein [Deltaproteobacteria bacterium]
MNAVAHERDGTEVALHYGDPEGELRALRTGVVLADLGHMGLTLLGGSHAWEVADRVLPRDLYLRDGQARQTLLLDEDGIICADVLVASDDDDLLLVTDGLPPEEVRARLTAAIRTGEAAHLEPLDADHALLEITGPYAWELMASFHEPGILGQPYLTLSHLDDGVRCLRAGRTGEYAYDLLVPRDRLEGVVERLLDLGRDLAIRRVGSDALDYAALENWFFNPHLEGRLRLTPLHLQLQWRVSRAKQFCGVAALAAWRARGLDRRVTAVRGPRGLAAGQQVMFGDTTVGELIVAAADRNGLGSIGLALLDLRLAESGLDVLVARGPDAVYALRTVSPPFVVNHSLLIQPQRDSFATRGQIDAPPGSWT